MREKKKLTLNGLNAQFKEKSISANIFYSGEQKGLSMSTQSISHLHGNMNVAVLKIQWYEKYFYVCMLFNAI